MRTFASTNLGHLTLRNGLALALMVSGMVVSGPGTCQAATTAEEHIQQGIALRKGGNDQAALAEFVKAYEISHTPRAAAQLALCEQAIGRSSDAEGHMIEALASKGDPWVEKNRAILKDALETTKQNVARIEVVGSPKGAEISVAGQVIGTLPMAGPAPVNAGTLDIEISAPGYRTTTRSVTLAGGAYQRLLIRLVASEAPAPLEAKLPLPAEPALAPTVADQAVADTDETQPLYKRTWFWVAAGAAIAAVTVGAFVLSGGTSYPDPGQRLNAN